MKVYEIFDKESNNIIGCLMYFEREKSFIIELQDNLDEWTAPLLFMNLVKKGTFTINREMSFVWVNERIIPSGRQNIDCILANAKMTAYDEMTLLDKSKGECSQDNFCIRPLKIIPKFVKERMKQNIIECVICGDYSLLCFFEDGKVKKINLNKVDDEEEEKKIKKITSNSSLYKSGHIAAGGYCVTFNDTIDIDARKLYTHGFEIPISLSDFVSFVDSNIVDATGCCSILECSRQNLVNYLSKNVLLPLKKDMKGNLYSKGNIFRCEMIDYIYRK